MAQSYLYDIVNQNFLLFYFFGLIITNLVQYFILFLDLFTILKERYFLRQFTEEDCLQKYRYVPSDKHTPGPTKLTSSLKLNHKMLTSNIRVYLIIGIYICTYYYWII